MRLPLIIKANHWMTGDGRLLQSGDITASDAALIGTKYEVTDEDKAVMYRDNLESFEIDKEKNLEYCASLGLTKEEFLDMLTLKYIYGRIASGHIVLVYNDMAAFYNDKYKEPIETTKNYITQIYNEYMFEQVKGMDYEELKPEEMKLIREAVSEVNEKADAFRKSSLK